MRVVISGCKEFKDYERFRNEVVAKLNEYIGGDTSLISSIEIVSGSTEDTDRMAEQLASEYNLKIKTFKADWDTLGKTAGFTRNKEMVLYAMQDTSGAKLIAFWDGESGGTAHTMELANVAGITIDHIDVRQVQIREIAMNILEAENGIICQQVNCQGVMGSGLALQIKEKWPNVYTDYMEYCKGKTPKELLGSIQISGVSEGVYVCNIFGQEEYGREERVYTDYEAVYKALVSLRDNTSGDIYIPYKMCCGLAHGNWSRVLSIIEYVFRYSKRNVLVCKLT